MQTESYGTKPVSVLTCCPQVFTSPTLVFAIKWLIALGYIIQAPVSALSGRIWPMGGTAGD